MARVPYLDRSDVPETHRDSMNPTNPFMPGGEAGDSPWESVRHTHRVLANNPPLLAAYRRFAAALWTETGLTERQRELAILGCARGLDSAYEWHQHVIIALDHVLSAEEVSAVAERDYERLGDDDAALVAFAVAFAEGAVDDATYEALAGHFDTATVVGASLLLGYYVGVDYMGRALALDLEEPFVGWELDGI